MAELADALGSGPSEGKPRGSSSLPFGTVTAKDLLFCFNGFGTKPGCGGRRCQFDEVRVEKLSPEENDRKALLDQFSPGARKINFGPTGLENVTGYELSDGSAFDDQRRNVAEDIRLYTLLIVAHGNKRGHVPA